MSSGDVRVMVMMILMYGALQLYRLLHVRLLAEIGVRVVAVVVVLIANHETRDVDDDVACCGYRITSVDLFIPRFS